MTADNVRSLAVHQPAHIAMKTENLDTLTVAKMLAESGFFGEVRQAGQALAKMLAGQELGMGPIASLMGVYYQQGKVTYSANIMAAAVKRSGVYSYRVRKHDTTVCEIEFFERGESVGTSSFTIEEARQASLVAPKGNWEKYPRNMLFARAMSNGCKWFCPDIFGGVTPYTPDEIGANVVMSGDGDIRVVDVTPTSVQAERCDKQKMLARWAVAVKGTRFDDEETRHKFVAWYTANEYDSLGKFLDSATHDEASAILVAIRDRIEYERKKAAKQASEAQPSGVSPARAGLIQQLEAAVFEANDLGMPMEMPATLPDLTDEQVADMLADAVRSLEELRATYPSEETA